MFRLTEEEVKIFSRSQVGTLKGRGHNIKYLPYVFTEQGVAMLATVLRTPVAEEVSIRKWMLLWLERNVLLLPR